MVIKLKWQYLFALVLILLSTILYGFHYLMFHDAYNIFFYFFHNIAFIPIQVILVGLILDKILENKEKEKVMKKLNMVIGVFFSEAGIEFVKKVSECDNAIIRYKDNFTVKETYSSKDLKKVRESLAEYKGELVMDREAVLEIGNLLVKKRDFLIKLIENPVLLEHETFTELLMAVFHIVEEIAYRKEKETISEEDLQHLVNDIKRAYNIIVTEWIEYLIYLKENYPYLYASAVFTNPFLAEKNNK